VLPVASPLHISPRGRLQVAIDHVFMLLMLLMPSTRLLLLLLSLLVLPLLLSVLPLLMLLQLLLHEIVGCLSNLRHCGPVAHHQRRMLATAAGALGPVI